MYITLTPAYGRDYKSAKAAKVDWADGKDFVINAVTSPDDGRYINKPQADETSDNYSLRFCKLTKICNV